VGRTRFQKRATVIGTFGGHASECVGEEWVSPASRGFNAHQSISCRSIIRVICYTLVLLFFFAQEREGWDVIY
jgi:hypothetical protein